MSDAQCRQWRGALGARALGLPAPGPDVGFDGHLEGCGECRRELDSLRSVASALRLADVEHLDVRTAGPDLEERIVRRIATEARAARRKTWIGAAAGAAVAATVLFVALVVTGEGGERGRQVVLAADGGTAGSAALVGRPWGTEITLRVTGLDRDEVYWLWLSDTTGERVGAGTLTGTDGEVTAVLASALPLDEARRIWMTDEDSEVTLDARIDPG